MFLSSLRVKKESNSLCCVYINIKRRRRRRRRRKKKRKKIVFCCLFVLTGIFHYLGTDLVFNYEKSRMC
jgi:hypothetical protein